MTELNVFKIASDSLRANIMTLPSGKFVSAGQNQFLTLWTRDFCHAVRGLLVIGEDEVAKGHLSYLLKSLREDGLVPRVVDNHIVQFRVAWQSFRKLAPFLPKLKFKEPLKAQYIDEHGSNAVDSNLLVLLSSLMVKKAGHEEWWNSHETELKRVFYWYDSQFKDGLIWQTPFADWQDSVTRTGHTFLTNLFYFLVASRVKSLGWEVKKDLSEFQKILHETFFHEGVYRTMVGSEIVSLEGNLFAIEADEFLNQSQKNELWKKLLAHPLTQHGLGSCSFPEYSVKDIAWHVKFAQLHGYHGRLAWSWLMGLGLKACLIMKDKEATKKQMDLIGQVLMRDQVVMELYDPEKDWLPWESWLLKAEHPFAWGSGYLIESLKLYDSIYE